MKKTIFIIIIAFLIIISTLYINLVNVRNNNKEIKQFNITYEDYLNKDVYGIDLATIINKAIDNNRKYEIQKDENELYIDDFKYCIKIEIKLLLNEESYQMETIGKVGIENFVENFNTIVFKCTKIEYHEQTNRVSKLYFEEIQI